LEEWLLRQTRASLFRIPAIYAVGNLRVLWTWNREHGNGLWKIACLPFLEKAARTVSQEREREVKL